jgi:L-aspartate oxidase
VTEAVRGEGARLIDNAGRRFLEGIHPAAELAPRDIVSRAIVEHLARPGVTGVFLDMRHWPAGRADARFPGLARRCRLYGLDPARDLIPVRPAAHYFIGGVAVDIDGRSDVAGLFACGEASCSGLHGANRLATNSLLEGLVLGERTGQSAARDREGLFEGRIRHRTERSGSGATDLDLDDLRKSLASRMWRCLGVVRDASGLAETGSTLATWSRFLAPIPLFSRGAFELENLLALGSLLTAAATRREESRGTHYRSDFPEPEDRLCGSFLWRRGEQGRFVPRGEVSVG